MMIVIYGLGKRYRNKSEMLRKACLGDQVVYADQNTSADCNEKSVINPESIIQYSYDFVVVTPMNYVNIKKELVRIGVQEEKVVSVEEFLSVRAQGIISSYPVTNSFKVDARKILVYVDHLGFHGGGMVCYYASSALLDYGYSVTVGCGTAPDDVINMYNNSGIDVIVFNSFPFIGGKDIDVFGGFDLVIVSTVPAISVAHFISRKVPTIWWIHEAEDCNNNVIYKNAIGTNSGFLDDDWMEKIRIIAVSRRAQSAFAKAFNVTPPILPVGIKDESRYEKVSHEGIVVATIGYIREDKNQLQFVEAAKSINSDDASFLVIGAKQCSDDYYQEILNYIGDGITLIGELTPEQLMKGYQKIDIVVCPSLVESLSMTVIEGMMRSKIVIASDGTGISDYIEDGINGFVFKTGDLGSLTKKMQYAIDNIQELGEMRKKARETYENFFSLEKMGKALKQEIECFT